MDQEFAIARKMLCLGNRMVNNRSADIETLELTPVQAESLHYFHDNPGGNAAGLKSWLKVSHQAARALVERMRTKGFLRVDDSDSDGRSRAVYLSERGEEAYAAIEKYGHRMGLTMLEGFSAEEKKQLGTMLDRMLSATE